MRVVLVTGLPCSGKTTFVAENRKTGDLVVDYDLLAQALGSPDTHEHPNVIRPFIWAAREAVLNALAPNQYLRYRGEGTAWITACEPSKELRAIADEVVDIKTDVETCKRRATAAGRPPSWHDVIEGMARGRARDKRVRGVRGPGIP